ncbi:MAG: hypothetical protein ACUVS1_08845 [Actinomycetota bacterium]
MDLFPSRFLIALLIPLIILGLGIWFTVSTEVNRGSVRVAGALLGQPEIELIIQDCYVREEEGARNLTVVLEAHNLGSAPIDIDPRLYHAVLSHIDDPLGGSHPQSSYTPIRYQSLCEQAPLSLTFIPAGATRSFTLIFWGRDLPRGEEWKDYYLSLEYYDPGSSLMASKLLNPAER